MYDGQLIGEHMGASIWWELTSNHVVLWATVLIPLCLYAGSFACGRYYALLASRYLSGLPRLSWRGYVGEFLSWRGIPKPDVLLRLAIVVALAVTGLAILLFLSAIGHNGIVTQEVVAEYVRGMGLPLVTSAGVN